MADPSLVKEVTSFLSSVFSTPKVSIETGKELASSTKMGAADS